MKQRAITQSVHSGIFWITAQSPRYWAILFYCRKEKYWQVKYWNSPRSKCQCSYIHLQERKFAWHFKGGNSPGNFNSAIAAVIKILLKKKIKKKLRNVMFYIASCFLSEHDVARIKLLTLCGVFRIISWLINYILQSTKIISLLNFLSFI